MKGNLETISKYAELERKIDKAYLELTDNEYHEYINGLLDALQVTVPFELFNHFLFYTSGKIYMKGSNDEMRTM